MSPSRMPHSTPAPSTPDPSTPRPPAGRPAPRLETTHRAARAATRSRRTVRRVILGQRDRSGTRARLSGVGLALGAALLLGACSGGTDATDGRLRVVVGAYPFAYLAETIGGGHVAVDLLTRPGAEPHDLELTAAQVTGVGKADLAVTLGGFQPAVDQAIKAAPPRHTLDLSAATGISVEHHDEEHAIAPDGHESPEDLAHDPHFWLDPALMGRAADAVADELRRIDPAHAGDYDANRDRLDAQLRDLRDAFRSRLTGCRSTTLVTSHAAYGHLAAFTGFDPYALALTPDTEPSAGELAQIVSVVRSHDVTTIYTEPLASPKVADVIATETGVPTAVLDPIEGLTDTSAGRDYLSLMRADLETLVTGQQCRP